MLGLKHFGLAGTASLAETQKNLRVTPERYL